MSEIWPIFDEINAEKLRLPYSSFVEYPYTWKKRPPRMLLDCYDRGFADLLGPLERRTHAKVISHYTDAILRWSHCLLVGNTFQCAYAGGGEQWARSIAGFPPDHPWRRDSGLFLAGSRVGLDGAKWTPKQVVDGRVLLGCSDEPANWGLFLLYVIPAAFYFLDNRDTFDKFMCWAPPDSTYRDLLYGIGIDEDFVHQDVRSTYRIPHLAIIRNTSRDMFVSPPVRASLLDVGRSVIRQVGSADTRRIFLSRHKRLRPVGSYRNLENELELIDGLRPLGFQPLDLEYMAVSAQIQALAAADVVVGLGGAGMFNVVFSKPGTIVIDLESTPVFVEAHSNLFASCDLDYSIILGKEDDSDPTPAHKRWFINVPRVVEMIRSILQ